MNSREQGASFCAVVLILLIVSALLYAAPRGSALLVRTAGLAVKFRKHESEPVEKVFYSLPSSQSGFRIERRLIRSNPSISTFAGVLYPRDEGILLDLEFSPSPALHPCPASALEFEPLLNREDPNASSAHTCALTSTTRVSQSSEMLSNVSAPELELSADSPLTLIIAGWLRLDSLRVLGSARVIVGGNVAIGEVHVPQGSDLRLHSATGMVEVSEVFGSGRSLVSGHGQAPTPLQGMEASLQVLPRSEVRLLGLRRAGDAG